MSASERLAALDAVLRDRPVDDMDSLRRLGASGEVLDALPEIVAVVQAAEKMPHMDDQGFLTGLRHPTPCSYCDALDALEGKLA